MAPNRRHYISLLSLTADIFKTPEPICMIFGALQRRLFLNTHVNSTFINFKTQNGATWRHSATQISLSTTAAEFQHKILIRTTLVRFQSKIDSSRGED